MTAIRPRRSVLYMPGANERALEKAKTLPADSLILDLEDAVAPEAKPEARERVCAAVKAGGYGPRELVIRVNSPDTEWGAADIKAACAAGPDAILAPKVDSADDIARLDAALKSASSAKTPALWVMIETPLAILNIKEIIEYGSVTEIPMVPPFIRGVINLRGNVVPVLDLAARFGFELTRPGKRTCIVIIELAEGEERQDIGVVVDSVSEVLEIPASEIEPPPAFGARIRADFIKGMGKVSGKFVIILDVAKVLSVDEIASLSQLSGDAAADAVVVFSFINMA